MSPALPYCTASSKRTREGGGAGARSPGHSPRFAWLPGAAWRMIENMNGAWRSQLFAASAAFQGFTSAESGCLALGGHEAAWEFEYKPTLPHPPSAEWVIRNLCSN